MAEQQQDNLLDILREVIRNIKYIVLTTLIVAVLAAVITLTMPNYYQSTAVIHPVNPGLSSPGQIFGTSPSDLKYFGEKDDVDRIIAIAESKAVIDHLIEHFDLYTHYDIDQSKSNAELKMYKKTRRLFKVQKTKLGNVSISVEDTDPDMAHAMVNKALVFINQMNQQIIRNNMQQMMLAFESNIEDQQTMIAKLNDTLIYYRTLYGLYDVSSQSELIANIIGEAEAAVRYSQIQLEFLNNRPGSRRDSILKYEHLLAINTNILEAYTQDVTGRGSNLHLFSEGAGKIRMLEEQLENLALESIRNQERYNKLRSAHSADIPGIFVLSAGERPLEKLRPKRTIIVLGAALAAFIFSVLGVLAAQASKEYSWKELLKDPASKA